VLGVGAASSGIAADVRHAEMDGGRLRCTVAHGLQLLRGSGQGGLDRGDLWNSPRPAAANSWPSCGSPRFRNPDATGTTSCTGPPGAAILSTRPPRPTAGGTTSPPRQPRDRSPWIKTHSCRVRNAEKQRLRTRCVTTRRAHGYLRTAQLYKPTLQQPCCASGPGTRTRRSSITENCLSAILAKVSNPGHKVTASRRSTAVPGL
jgi:hypothetical protein